ncbi:MAG: sulfate adenylyltransferase subunit CysN [Ferrovibrio sp.]
MSAAQDAVTEIEAYLSKQESKTLLRFITCGSVDDGKSTLIGRLLFDSKLLFEDQLAALQSDSRRYGTTGSGELDLALLVDGLADEREQGITIDVAYRFFTTDKRKFIVADTPGHEQYTRNMATGASTADAAVLLIDARKGLAQQTYRHSYIVSLLGIRHVILAVNKMDLVDWDESAFRRIEAEYRSFAERLGVQNITSIPVSALKGDNVTQPSAAMPWYKGPPLLGYLEELDVSRDLTTGPFRMPVQWINRPNQDFRGYSGTIVSGSIAPGDSVAVLPGGAVSRVKQIVTYDGDLSAGIANQAVTITLADEIDISRGSVLVDPARRPEVADQLAAHILWMGTEHMLPGRPYLMQIGPTLVSAQITELKHVVNINTLEHIAARHLSLNEIGFCNLALDHPIPFDSYRDCRDMGAFILIDRITNATIGCGMIDFALRRAANIHWQPLKVGKQQRAAMKGQKPCVLWLTGLSGAGKSTIADLVEAQLASAGKHTILLDGDNVRHGLNKDLGFADEDRVENIRRVAEVAKLMVDAGLIVIVSFISPFRNERQLARDLLAPDEFLEIYIDAPLDICEARDPKGLYKKARAGKIPNFTGITSPYEPPESPELHIHSDRSGIAHSVEQIIALLRQGEYI